jgi:hypothetical protein
MAPSTFIVVYYLDEICRQPQTLASRESEKTPKKRDFCPQTGLGWQMAGTLGWNQ